MALALEAWVKLTVVEREGLSPPPQIGTECAVSGRGSRNARGARTLDQVMQDLVCGS